MNADWVQQLHAQFGDAITTDVSAFAVQGITPACVCAPADEAQAAAVIRFAAAQRIPVVPCGGGTEQGKGLPPAPDFLALSTRRMNKLIHHEPGDMVATVQGGMSLDDFQIAIDAGGQWLPVQAPPDATIGGIVAANTFGSWSLGYGTLRDMILGMTVINGDGVIRKCGGKVVKNVTGYSLDKLYIGSLGTLGVVTEVTFKLRPFPLHRCFWQPSAPSVQIAIEAMRAISAKNLPLESLELVNFGRKNIPITLSISAAGTDAELKRINSDVRAVRLLEFRDFETDSEYVSTRYMPLSAHELDSVRQARQRTESGASVRVGFLSSMLESVLSIFQTCPGASFRAGLTDGLIRIASLTESEAARIASEFEKLGINFAFENVVGVNIPNRWGSPRPEWAIMKQIKSALDPAGIMNPGRFVC